MSQTSYSIDFSSGLDGQIVSGRHNTLFESLQAEDNIPFGRILLASADDEEKTRLPHAKKATLDLDADLIASNTLAGNVVINGTTYAYSKLYATSSTATLTALKNDLVALAGGTKVTGAVVGNNIVLTATPGNDVYFDTGAVTGGVSQAVVTLINTDAGVFDGISAREERQPDGNNVAQYPADSMVSVARRGRFYVRSKDALAKNDTAYVQLVAGSGDSEKPGMLASAAGAGKVPCVAMTQLHIRKGCAAGGYAEVAIAEAT